jgi:hypothetical protein
MAFIPVPNAVQCILEYGDSAGDVTWTNTLWFYSTDFDTGDMLDLANAIVTWANTYITPVMASYWYVKGCTAYDMSSQTAPIVNSTTSGSAGALTGQTSPVSIAAVVTFYTEQRGRSSRGRNYVCGFREDDTSATTFDGGIATDLIDAYEELLSGLPNAFDWSVCSRYTGGSPRTSGVMFSVTSVDVRNNFFGSQRRRVDRP